MYQYSVTLKKELVSDLDVKFRCSEEVALEPWVHNLFLDDNDKEHFYILCLNVKNKIVGYNELSKGSLTSSVVHPREALKTAILSNSASVIFVHNHPSGDPEPSNDDIQITHRLVKSFNLLGINVLDHIILGFDAEEMKNYYSFKQKGIL